MKENLKVTHYNDGTQIPIITDNTEWSNLSTPAYCWYNNDEATNKNLYGALYNWYTVNTGNICPVGWHVPTNDDWTILTSYLGGENVAGGKIKSTRTVPELPPSWNSPNNGATNESSFSALPAGKRYENGVYNYIGDNTYWWSSTSGSDLNAGYRNLYYNEVYVFSGFNNKKSGYSIRCVSNY